MAYILGLNLSHDRSACIVEDGEVLVAIEEERLDRIKHSEGFLVQGHFERITKTLPMKAVTYCLDTVGIGLDDVSLVIGNRPLGDGTVRRITRELPIKDKSKIRELPMPSHHMAHAAIAYYCSRFEEAAVLIVDQAGSRFPNQGIIEKHTMFDGEGMAIRPVAGTTYPVDYTDMSLGLFYDFFTVKLNFLTRYGTPDFGLFECGGYPEAGKTMGLAPYGRPRPEWGDWLTFDGIDIHVSQKQLEDIWADLLRVEGAHYEPTGPLSWQHDLAKDVAYKVQDELEKAMLYLAHRAHEITGRRFLCLAGGVTLNSVANQRILTDGPFDDVFIPAPAGDSGTAIGTALFAYHHLLRGERRTPMLTPTFGRTYDRQRVLDALEAVKPHVHDLEWQEAEISEVADLIAQHYVVGWFVGGSEMGPRALGHRSILADARHPRTRDYLNEVVKHREVFRPYAPSVLDEHAAEWFDLDRESPFMLFVSKVREAYRGRVPAITHVDSTARVQTVRPEVHPEFHELLSKFNALTGVPLVLNTSFNDAGEPIVERPEDALCTFARAELDFLYIEGILVSKRGRQFPPGHPRWFPLAGV